jgi:lysophospholipase L1-like esterase
VDLVVWGGINDIQSGNKASNIIEGYRKIIHLADKADVNLILCTVSPYAESNASVAEKNNGRIAKLNNWLRTSNQRNKGYVLGDIARVVTGQDGFLKDEYNHDGYHMNANGYRAVARVINGKVVDLRLINSPNS